MSVVMVIGANSVTAKAIMPQLSRHQVLTAGRRNCDVYCDVTKEVMVPDGVDVIINFAAAFGGASKEEIDLATQTNVAGVLRVCEAAHKAGVQQVVHISSIFAVQSPGDPNFSVYASTKKQGDSLAEAYATAHSLPLAILRPSRIYGDDYSFAKGQPFLYHLIDTAAQGEDIEFYGKQDAKRNYIHVSDLGEVLVRVITQKIEGIYPLVHPQDVSISEIATIAQGVFAKGGRQNFRPDMQDIPHDMSVDDTSLYEKIGYYPVIDMQTGIARIKEGRERELLK